jgi:hypothetical protein
MIVKHWPIRHFSQANPRGPEQGNVPALLRRVAATIEELGDVNVEDITFGTEVTAEGPWYSLSVYFHGREEGGEEG